MRNITLSLGCLMLTAVTAAKAQTPGLWHTITAQSKCLMLQDSKIANGTPVAAWTVTDVPAEKWSMTDNGNGTVSFRSAYMEKYMCTPTSAKAGATLTSSSIKRNANWRLNKVEGKSDTYTISSADGSLLLMLEDDSDGALPVLRPAAGIETPTEWKISEFKKSVPQRFDSSVRDAMMTGFINQYYKPAADGYMLGSGGFWSDAEMFETMLDAFETTGNDKYGNYCRQLISNFISRNGRDWSSNPFNDDIAWMVLVCARAYRCFGDIEMLDLARDNFERMYARALQPGGTLRWSQDASDHGSNSCINGPATVALCTLHELTGDSKYLERAKRLWKAQYDTLCDKNDGHIWDSGSWNADWTEFKVGNYWGSTYNQGTMLGASILLYRLTGDEAYRDYADKVYGWAYSNLTARESPRIVNACQTATGDLSGFKGILMRYVRIYAEETGDEAPLHWLEDNAFHAYQNSNSRGVVWSRWMSKTPEDFRSVEGDEVKDFSNDAFGASTAVSAAFNAHVNRTFVKDAAAGISADMPDGLQWWKLDTRRPGTTAGGRKGAWLCFRNVEFPSAGTESVTVCAGGDKGAVLAVYSDSISDGTLLARIEVGSDGNGEISIPTTRSVTGRHTLYVVSEGEAPATFSSMIFKTASSVCAIRSDLPYTGMYDIQGHPLKSPPAHGIYIINGIKTF